MSEVEASAPTVTTTTEGGAEEDKDDSDAVVGVSKDGVVAYSAEVQKAIAQVLPGDDPFSQADFDVTAHINALFPTEKSLGQLDDVIAQVSSQMVDVDSEMAELVQAQGAAAGAQGQTALRESRTAIQELFGRIRDIRASTDTSDGALKEMTREIKKYDVVKRNLTDAITTLHHLHILLSGLESLHVWMEQRAYGDIAKELPAVLNVFAVFDQYISVPQVKQLADQVQELKQRLRVQVADDVKQRLTGGAAGGVPSEMLDMCRVAAVVDPALKTELTAMLVDRQLREYRVLFADTEDDAWLDRIDRRYRWYLNKFTEFESSGMAQVFPADWEIEWNMTVQFCAVTRDMLDSLIQKRMQELDARVLTHAIGKTAQFEGLLTKRFPAKRRSAVTADDKQLFVWRVFDKYLHVFIAAQDANFHDFIDQCVGRFRDVACRPQRETSPNAFPLPSSGDLFLFFKRTMVEVAKISTRPEKLLAQMVPVFRKYLNEYALRCLTAFLPYSSSSQPSGGSSGAMSSTAGLLQSLMLSATAVQPDGGSSLMSGGGVVARLTPDEQFLCCCILATADWCADTTQQLQDKLREKMPNESADSVDMSQEMDLFYQVSSKAVMVLVQDLESACDAALQAMVKINWSTVERVGDESGYVGSIKCHLRQHIPVLRDYLCDRRKYFAHLCLKLVGPLTAKYVASLCRCRSVSVSGAEQLLLDAHSLKTFLLQLPAVDAVTQPKPPTAYLKAVNGAMTHAEMLLKAVMSPLETPEAFIGQYRKLLPDSNVGELQKVLEMKAVRRHEQVALIELYRAVTTKQPMTTADVGATDGVASVSSTLRNPAAPLMSLTTAGSGHHSRMRKLERLVNKKL